MPHRLTRSPLCRLLSLTACAACALLTTLSAHGANESTLRCAPSGALYDYRWALLKLALDHTRPTGSPFRIDQVDSSRTTQSRLMAMMQAGALDVMALPPNPEREANMRPIRVDILRGMLGYRVLLIRKSDAAWFQRLQPVDLKGKIKLGFNSQWADLAILQANGFQVVASPGYEGLFAMLDARRFDAFPRGLNEFSKELTQYGSRYPELAVDKTYAFFTPYPVYFWVRRGNEALARQIENGLNLALRDGSFKKLFIQYHQQEIGLLKRENRRVLFLNNPMLPRQGADQDYSWWLPKSVKIERLP